MLKVSVPKTSLVVLDWILSRFFILFIIWFLILIFPDFWVAGFSLFFGFLTFISCSCVRARCSSVRSNGRFQLLWRGIDEEQSRHHSSSNSSRTSNVSALCLSGAIFMCSLFVLYFSAIFNRVLLFSITCVCVLPSLPSCSSHYFRCSSFRDL